MKKKIIIDGMTCQHCVAHVREALEELGASEIDVVLEEGYASANTLATDEQIRTAIDDAGYDVISIE